MFCSKCGTKLSEGASFCSGCGNKVMNQQSSTGDTPVQPTEQQRIPMSSGAVSFDGPSIFFICVNISLIVLFYLGWIKVAGMGVEDFFELLNELDLKIRNSISPKLMLDAFKMAKKFGELGAEVPPAANVFYLLYLMPICGVGAILSVLIKKTGLAKTFSIIGSIVIALTFAVALLMAGEPEMDLHIGAFVAIVVFILLIVAVVKLKRQPQ